MCLEAFSNAGFVLRTWILVYNCLYKNFR